MNEMKYNNSFIKFGIGFDFMCHCGNDDKTKFLAKAYKNKVTLLCLECEKKYEVKIHFREIK